MRCRPALSDQGQAGSGGSGSSRGRMADQPQVAPTRNRMAATGKVAGCGRARFWWPAGRAGRNRRAETPQTRRLTERFRLKSCARTRADAESCREDSVSRQTAGARPAIVWP
jgi:hypothetical protein